MSTHTEVTKWLKQCPELKQLWNVSAYEEDGANVIIPSGSSYKRSFKDTTFVNGGGETDIIPLPTIYEEYQINCYRTIVSNDNEFNALKYDEVKNVIAWVEKQDDIEHFPEIGRVIAVECFPFIPQIRGVDPDTGLICYYITLRITYPNNTIRKTREW